MAFEVEWTKTSLQQLRNLERFIAERIIKKIKFFSLNASLKNAKKLKQEDAFKMRIGDYRIFFDKISKNKIRIIKVGHRKNIYKK